MKRKPPTVFWGNERVNHEAILIDHQEDTRHRLQGLERVLLVQDTTSFNFSHHPATTGMGYLENEYSRGFLAHTTLAVSDTGVPFGILEQQLWVRSDEEKGKRHRRKNTAFAEKESYKWVRGLGEVPEGVSYQELTVCDREAHIYQFLAEALDRNQDFIVRAAQGRSFTTDGEEIFAPLTRQEAQAVYEIELKRHPERAARKAKVELRYAEIELQRPKHCTSAHETLTIRVVEVQEMDTPEGETPVYWLLLTSLPVDNVDQAQEIVRFYSYRWLVERFHYVLKSGCKLEESQLREEKRLERLLGVYSLVAWQLLWLTYSSRQNPDASCTDVLQEHEWQALYAFINKRKTVPESPPNLKQAVRWIAQLGGFLGRKGDGDPGVKVLWRGWTRLQDISQTWILFDPSPSKNVGNA
jgi:hypothetical protein